MAGIMPRSMCRCACLWSTFSALACSIFVWHWLTIKPPEVIPPSPSPTSGFDVSGAHDILNLAWAAYCNRTALATWTCQWCNRTKGVALVRYLKGKSMGTQGYVAVDATNKRIIVAIRGSNNPMNAIEDGMMFRDHWAPAPKGALVHHGFKEAYISLKKNITEGIAEGRKQCEGCEVLVTGHSLGAAMATLAASDVAAQAQNGSGRLSVRLYTFGSPRVGNAVFARWATKLLSNSSMRMVREYDIIPSLASQKFGYRHLPTEVWNRHRKNMNDWYVVCDNSGEDPKCSDSEWSLQMEQHTRYMGFKGGYCRGGEKLVTAVV